MARAARGQAGTKSEKDKSQFAWIQVELDRVGKTQVALAKALNVHPSRVSKLISGEYKKVRGDEIRAIRSFLGLGANFDGVRDEAATEHQIPVVGIAEEGVFVDPMSNRARVRRTAVYSPETTKWGKKRYALELAEPIDPNPRVESEWVVCVPMRLIKRKLEDGDLVHIEKTVNTLKNVTVRRVRRGDDGSLEYVPTRSDTGQESYGGNTKLSGLVVGRGIEMK